MRSHDTIPSNTITNGINGTTHEKNKVDQRNGRQKGAVTTATTGENKRLSRNSGSRLSIANTPIGWRARTAAPSISLACSGRKWWKAFQIVRAPGSDSGTAVASTGFPE